MLSDGSVTDDKQAVAEKFNDFFVNLGPNLAKKVPEQNQNQMWSIILYISPQLRHQKLWILLALARIPHQDLMI